MPSFLINLLFIHSFIDSVVILPASRLPASSRASWWAERSRGNQAEVSRDSTMLAMPTVRVLRSGSGAEEEPGAAGAPPG